MCHLWNKLFSSQLCANTPTSSCLCKWKGGHLLQGSTKRGLFLFALHSTCVQMLCNGLSPPLHCAQSYRGPWQQWERTTRNWLLALVKIPAWTLPPPSPFSLNLHCHITLRMQHENWGCWEEMRRQREAFIHVGTLPTQVALPLFHFCPVAAVC